MLRLTEYWCLFYHIVLDSFFVLVSCFVFLVFGYIWTCALLIIPLSAVYISWLRRASTSVYRLLYTVCAWPSGPIRGGCVKHWLAAVCRWYTAVTTTCVWVLHHYIIIRHHHHHHCRRVQPPQPTPVSLMTAGMRWRPVLRGLELSFYIFSFVTGTSRIYVWHTHTHTAYLCSIATLRQHLNQPVTLELLTRELRSIGDSRNIW